MPAYLQYREVFFIIPSIELITKTNQRSGMSSQEGFVIMTGKICYLIKRETKFKCVDHKGCYRIAITFSVTKTVNLLTSENM